jgi:hypothetical protein
LSHPSPGKTARLIGRSGRTAIVASMLAPHALTHWLDALDQAMDARRQRAAMQLARR